MVNKKIYLYFSGAYNNPDGTAIIKGNLGDLFGYYLLDYIINTNKDYENLEIIPINQKTPKSFIKDGIVLSLVGSILNHIPHFKNIPNVNFIGCGNINGDKITVTDNINILGVRGYLSKKSIEPNKGVGVVSDLGLLISEMFPIKFSPTKKTGYIIHSVDREYFFKKFPHLKNNLIDNYQSPEKFINELLQYEKIISSSLHGIIFSHSFNKEVTPIKITDKIIGGDFKFKDYYSSIGFDNISRLIIPETLKDLDELKLNNFNLNSTLISNIKNTQLTKIKNFLTALND
jgi:pyruvyltransferase